MWRRLVLVACCCFTLVVCQCDRIKDVLNALEKALDYVQANKRFMNVDAVFGLVLGQAHVAQIIAEHLVPGEYNRQMKTVASKLCKALKDTKALLEPTDRNLLFLPTVLEVKAWTRNLTFEEERVSADEVTFLQEINTYERYIKYLASSKFDEQNSDDCMMELLQQQKFCCVSHTCVVSHECYKTMGLSARRFDPAYGVTHSLLFLQVARSQGCKMKRKLLKKIIRKFCSYILWELRKNAEYGFLGTLDDLLLEQVTLCGFEGFVEFFSKNIIEHILWMQNSKGCFSVSVEERNFRSIGSREKRESNIIDVNCIDHTTGLGVSALTVTLRYLLQSGRDYCDYADY